MFTQSDVLNVLASYFPASRMDTGADCASELLEKFNAEVAAISQPTINVVNDVNVIRIADENSIRLVSDLIARQFRERKITAIKELRGAFPNLNLKQSKDSIEDSFRRCGFDSHGRVVPDTNEDEPLEPWERELLHGNPWNPTVNPDPINRPYPEQSDEPPF